VSLSKLRKEQVLTVYSKNFQSISSIVYVTVTTSSEQGSEPLGGIKVGNSLIS
jgi:hypothetical protein